MAEHPNCQAVETFLNQIASISRPIVNTKNIDGKPVRDGYTASYWDEAKGMGFTVLAWGAGHFKVVLEFGGKLDNAVTFGRAVDKALT